jgi:hypothetical protein
VLTRDTCIRNGGVADHFELDAGVEGVEERLEGKGVSYMRRE